MATNTLTRRIAQAMNVEPETLDLWLSVTPDGVPDKDKAAFVYQCVRTGLDPLARQIYLVKRTGRGGEINGVVQTGIDGYRLIADRTGAYAGSDDPIYDEGLNQYAFLKTERKTPSTATVSVYKIVGGVVCKFTATAEWSAYYPGSTQGYMWNKMPMLMLGKVAEALALRKAFPAQLSGIYTSEEMMQAGAGENDAAVDNIIKGMNVQNPHALHVLDKLESAGIDADDPLVTGFLGCRVAEVQNNETGSDKLKAVWAAANKKEKGAEWSAALFV